MFFGSRAHAILRKNKRILHKINHFGNQYSRFSEHDFTDKTAELKQRVAAGESLDRLLPEAFALVREASRRVLGLRHFDVQMAGGIILHRGGIAELGTGEGKTLVATLAAYLNALEEKGVHVVTANDYLARRDAAWMGRLYATLGLRVGVVVADSTKEARCEAYRADITYGASNEFGFDYLRDNQVVHLEDKVQRPLHYAIIDEVDSILIDEARTPLIISSSSEKASVLYEALSRLTAELRNEEDYDIEPRDRQVYLTDQGHARVEDWLVKEGLIKSGASLYDTENTALVYFLQAALRARVLYLRDQHYVVRDGEIVIIDEFTGRAQPGRRWADGLHQAIEAKERLSIRSESHTMATLTFQNYFRLYRRLAGMTGTALTEAGEFHEVYRLPVFQVPPHRPLIRRDEQDLVFLTDEARMAAVLDDIRECVARNQPVLVGTTTVEKSEALSTRLRREGIVHQVLNAKQNADEAAIIARAGWPGAVTVATNMAGRGTDIVLGGSLDNELSGVDPADRATIERRTAQWRERQERVIAAGGLRIIGVERHESRRIDRQLRGRAGRQGDPGSSQFYLSLEDPLLVAFGGQTTGAVIRRLGVDSEGVVTHPWISRYIEKAQIKVEAFNFGIRKSLIDYDDVINRQRQAIYGYRDWILATPTVLPVIEEMWREMVDALVNTCMPPKSLEEEWLLDRLKEGVAEIFGLEVSVRDWLDSKTHWGAVEVKRELVNLIERDYAEKLAPVDVPLRREIEKHTLLMVLDDAWVVHLDAMESLRQSIPLRGYAQKNPRHEYIKEGFDLFRAMVDRVRQETVTYLFSLTPEKLERAEAFIRPARLTSPVEYRHDTVRITPPTNVISPTGAVARPTRATAKKEPTRHHFAFTVNASGFFKPIADPHRSGRNAPCPCGSGLRVKTCHGRIR